MHRRGARRRGLHRNKSARFSESPADLSAAIRHRRLLLAWSPLDVRRRLAERFGWQAHSVECIGHKSSGGQLPPQKGSLHEPSIDAGPLDGARPAAAPPLLRRSTTTPPPRPGDRPPSFGCPAVAEPKRRGTRAAGDV